MIVLGITDAHHLVARQPELAKRVLEAGRLVDAGRQYHDGAAVADHLRLEPELPDNVLNGCSIRIERRYDHLPDNQSVLHKAVPIYETFPGWGGDLSDATLPSHLPPKATAYIEFLEDQDVGCFYTAPACE